jgi:hypothetical protein
VGFADTPLVDHLEHVAHGVWGHGHQRPAQRDRGLVYLGNVQAPL